MNEYVPFEAKGPSQNGARRVASDYTQSRSTYGTSRKAINPASSIDSLSRGKYLRNHNRKTNCVVFHSRSRQISLTYHPHDSCQHRRVSRRWRSASRGWVHERETRRRGSRRWRRTEEGSEGHGSRSLRSPVIFITCKRLTAFFPRTNVYAVDI